MDEGEEEEVDPLVFAVTNSLKKLIAAQDPSTNSAGTRGLSIKRRNRRFSNEPPEEDEEEEPEEVGDGEEGGSESGGDGSSTTSREEDKYEEIRREIGRLQRQIHGTNRAREHEDDEGEEEGATPLSVSPGSRARSRRESSASYR